MIRRFDSIAALRAEALRVDAFSDRNFNGYGDKRTHSFFGGETVAQTLQRLELGDPSLVPDAERLITQITSEIATSRRTWSRSPAGAFPCVPEAIAGLPTSMRRMQQTASEFAPITVFAASTISAVLSAEFIRARGATILALVLALIRTRPVALWTVATMDGRDDGDTIICARINTAPLDLATACYALTSPGFARRVNYGIGARINGFSGGWARTRGDKLVAKLSDDPANTLYIKGADVASDPMVLEPVEWINAQIRRFTQSQEEDQ